tara:strand:- start:5009 stop:5386 length:378 start_codon:yes stop_codon:yes gene_type:complete
MTQETQEKKELDNLNKIIDSHYQDPEKRQEVLLLLETKIDQRIKTTISYMRSTYKHYLINTEHLKDKKILSERLKQDLNPIEILIKQNRHNFIFLNKFFEIVLDEYISSNRQTPLETIFYRKLYE